MLRTENPTRPRTLDDLLDARLAAQLNGLDIASRKVFAGKMKGERKSKRKGDSVEFADHRQYAVGDDLRRLDWHIFARLDRLFLKLFLEDEDLSLHIVIDATPSMDCGEPGKFLFAQKLAAAIAYVGLTNLHRVALSAIGGSLTGASGESGEGAQGAASVAGSSSPLLTLRDMRGRRRIHDVGEWLCALEPGDAQQGALFSEGCKRIALSRRGKGVTLVLSDFFLKEGYETGLRYLLGRGHDVFVIQTLSPQELEPTLGGDLKLKDVEDADMAEVTISAPLLKRYKINLGAYIETLRAFCARREIAMLSVRSDTPVETLVLDYLRTRGLLR